MRIVLLFLLLAGTAAAHPLSVSYSRFTLSGPGVEADFRLPMDDMDLLLQIDRNADGSISPAELQAARGGILDYLRKHVDISNDGVALKPQLQWVSPWQDSYGFPFLEARVLYPASTVRKLKVGVHVLTDLYSNHRDLAEFDMAGRQEEFVFQNGNTWTGGPRGSSDAWRTVRQFTLLGMEHIWTGYDHILFLLGLLLVGRGLRNLIAIVTSFTLAHSLTLALATLGIVHPIGWMVEATIALTIAYVGLENLVMKDIRHRWRLTFLFGLAHGFGFASVLQQMNLERSGLVISLFTFNLGVEIGQVTIVALLWPLLRRLARSPYRNRIVNVISAIILGCGLYWFVQRVS